MATVNIYDMADTWNDAGTTFTAIKMDVTDTSSASGSLLMDLQVGSSSKFNVDKSGRLTFANFVSGGNGGGIASPSSNYTGITTGDKSSFVALFESTLGLKVPSGAHVAWASSNNANLATARDLYLTRKGAANLRLGAADAAAPVAQTLSVQSVVAGTSNTSGTDFTIEGSQGAGSGAGGSIIFKVAPAGSSGTAQNALVDALTITSAKEVQFDGPLWLSNAYTAGAPTPAGYLVVYDSTGTAYKIPAEAV